MAIAEKILVVDDEPKIVELVRAYLEAGGFQVHVAFNGKEALDRFRDCSPGLIVLDLMLPDIPGEHVCECIRNDSDVPIIMLTAKLQEESFINGLRIGADDYVTKPFSPKQLVAKVHALLRRAKTCEDGSHKKKSITIGGLYLNDVSHEVRKNGRRIDLTPNEFNILYTMMKYPYKVFTREELVLVSLGENYSGFDRMIDTYIKQLRQKIEDDARNSQYILTVHGVGYKFGEEL